MTQISETLRTRLRNLIGSEHRQLLSDYDVDPALLDNDPDHGMLMDALIDAVVHSVRLFDDQGRAYEAALAENERLLPANERLREALTKIADEHRHCMGDSDSMAMCIVSTEGVARAALATGGQSDAGD